MIALRWRVTSSLAPVSFSYPTCRGKRKSQAFRLPGEIRTVQYAGTARYSGWRLSCLFRGCYTEFISIDKRAILKRNSS
jgi:hypothetical protein